jgi:hypothetical protein
MNIHRILRNIVIRPINIVLIPFIILAFIIGWIFAKDPDEKDYDGKTIYDDFKKLLWWDI